LSKLLQHTRISRSLDLAPDPTHPGWLAALTEKLRNKQSDYLTSLDATVP
jgi:hypothetical protein